MALSLPETTDLTSTYAEALKRAGVANPLLSVQAHSRTLVLRGTVASFEEKHRAARLLAEVSGHPIHNRLVVAPGRDDDEALAERVRAAIKTFALPGNEILVIANGGSVTLAGRARSSRAALSAAAVAQCVDGVDEVRSRIVTTVLDDENDSGLAVTIRRELQDLLRTSSVDVSARAGEVVLDGSVANADLRDRAEAIARWHPGVTDVVNNLTVVGHDSKTPVG